MFRKNILLAVSVLLLQPLLACTTFFINKNGELVFGRNYDWITGTGMVCTNLRGLLKTSIKGSDPKTITWVSKYGSITFNQYGKEFPTGGMNEKGLVVELMWADGSQYPAPDDRPSIGVLQWIQYQLDNNATTDEVIASDAVVRISPNNPPLHYLVADENGNVATIEFIKGKLLVHKGKELPFPVLTNNFYSESAKTVIDANILSGNKSINFNDNSLQRFAQTCSMVQQFHANATSKPATDYAFEILNKVAQPGWTRWSIVYDVKKKKINFKTDNFTAIKSLTFSSLDFSCTSTPLAADLNQPGSGDFTKSLKQFDEAINRKIMEKAITESKTQVDISDESKEKSLAYAMRIRCR